MQQTEAIDNNGHRVSGLALFAAGLGAGVALALLLAPRSGASTRRLIGRRVVEGKGWVRDKTAATQAYVKDRGEDLRERVEEIAGAVGRVVGS